MRLSEPALAVQFAAARDAAREAATPQGFEGRGIVICAGGAQLFTCAWVLIGMLRRSGCDLPIEVWHLGPEELGPPMRDLISRWDVDVVDALEVARDHPVAPLGGWELKPYALMWSRFAEVLLLDADNMAVRDPRFLFDLPQYRSCGALFWSDVIKLDATNAIWRVTGLAPWTEASFESGQMVIDKRKTWPALTLTHWMNQNSSAFYDLVWGDKDTFLIAWLALDQTFHRFAHGARRSGDALLQPGPDGEVLFQHRTGSSKWVLAGLNVEIEGFQHREACLDLLAELGARWDGYVYNPPPRSDRARAQEAGLVRQGRWLLTRICVDQRPLEFLPSNRIGEGAQPDVVYWCVADGPEGPQLRLEHGGYVSCRLDKYEDGVWRGYWLEGHRTQAELTPFAPVPETTVAPPRDMALEALLDDLRANFDAIPPSAEAREAFRQALTLIARARPAAQAWLDDQILGGRVSPRALEAMAEAASRLAPRGSVGRRRGPIIYRSPIRHFAYSPLPSDGPPPSGDDAAEDA